VNPDMELSEARSAVPQAAFLKNARLWVDGFAGFTRQEFELLIEMLKAVAHSEIALCLDHGQLDLARCNREDLDPTSLFYPTECTCAELVEATRKCKLEMAAPLLLKEPQRFTSGALFQIERHLFAGGQQAAKADGAVRVLAGANRRAEAEFAAAQVHRLVRSGNCRYRDIAVVAPDVSAYRHYIEAAFRDCGIPFFIDIPRPLAEHPIARLALSAIRAVTNGFGNSDVFAFLKSGLGPLLADQVDLLHNYCDTCGVGGKDWTSQRQWHFAARGANCFDEAAVDRIRRDATRPLTNLATGLTRPDGLVSADEFTAAIFGLIEELHVRTKLATWKDDGEEHRRSFDKFVSLFDELAAVLAGMRMTPMEYADVLRNAVEGATLAIIPPRLDQVLVGAIERSRHPDLKAAILVGCCQTDFPSPVRRTSVLTDDDRIGAEAAGLRLGDTIETQLSSRRYLAYIAMTRASERLYLSWPMADEQGAPASQSEFIDGVTSLFSDVQIEFIKPGDASPEDIPGPRHLADVLCSQLGRDADPAVPLGKVVFESLLAGLRDNERCTELVGLIDAALDYDNAASIDKRTAGEAFGSDIRSSVTRLSSFAACPYQHFAKYMLKLKPRTQFRLEPLDLGEFYHGVLDSLTKQLISSGQHFTTIDQREILLALGRIIEKEFTSNTFLADFRARSPHNSFIVDEAAENLEECAKAIAQASRAGKLRTIASELVFDNTGKGLPPLTLPLSGGGTVSFAGKIDRLDVAKEGDVTAAFVFDYKTSGKSASWSDMYHGLDLQLPLYLLAIDGRSIGSSGKLSPAGAFFFPIQATLPRVTLAEMESQKEDKFRHKAYGLFEGERFALLDSQTAKQSAFFNFQTTKDNGPYGNYRISGAVKPGDYQLLLAFVRKQLARLAAEIVSGRINVQPYRKGDKSPCSTCDYRAVCRFDWQVNDYRFLTGINKEQVLDELRGANG
jgi:ATP-dependent helicase/nuclease subunit B